MSSIIPYRYTTRPLALAVSFHNGSRISWPARVGIMLAGPTTTAYNMFFTAACTPIKCICNVDPQSIRAGETQLSLNWTCKQCNLSFWQLIWKMTKSAGEQNSCHVLFSQFCVTKPTDYSRISCRFRFFLNWFWFLKIWITCTLAFFCFSVKSPTIHAKTQKCWCVPLKC